MSDTIGGTGLPARPLEILLIEDDDTDVQLINRAFKKGGIELPIRAISDGEAALDYLEKGASRDNMSSTAPAIVLLDLKLPKVNGLEVLKRIKASAVLKRLPVIVLTSSDQPDDVNQAYDLGANSYLVKPVSFADFCDLASHIKTYWLRLNTTPTVTL